MSNKRIIDFIQNLILVALAVSALYLMTCFPMMDGAVKGKMKEFLVGQDNVVQQTAEISSAVSAVHLVVTDQYEYGRYACLNIASDSVEIQKLVPLFREAIGSASVGEIVSGELFHAALERPCIYMDLGTALPVSVISAWLGETDADMGGREVRSMVLVATEETAELYFVEGNGNVLRCTSALTSNAVRELTASFAPNDGRFAFESGYETLAPYAILIQESPAAAMLKATLPSEYTAYNLLTALELNAHTMSRYNESNGVEVVMQSPLTLRIGVDGSVNSSADGDVPQGIYRLACAGETPTAKEALESAWTIAHVLREGTNAAEMTLDGVERTENGWIITFSYHVDGIRVYLGEDRDALRVVISGDTVTNFDFICRNYTPLEQSSDLLPPDMAVAIASMHRGAELTLAYVDSGAETLVARWFAQ